VAAVEIATCQRMRMRFGGDQDSLLHCASIFVSPIISQTAFSGACGCGVIEPYIAHWQPFVQLGTSCTLFSEGVWEFLLTSSTRRVLSSLRYTAQFLSSMLDGKKEVPIQ
jgi:hypothetical protein